MFRKTSILSLVWQIIRVYLYSSISYQHCPEVVVLLEQGESENILSTMLPEELLLRWLRFHLRAVGADLQEKSFAEMKVSLFVSLCENMFNSTL